MSEATGASKGVLTVDDREIHWLADGGSSIETIGGRMIRQGNGGERRVYGSDGTFLGLIHPVMVGLDRERDRTTYWHAVPAVAVPQHRAEQDNYRRARIGTDHLRMREAIRAL